MKKCLFDDCNNMHDNIYWCDDCNGKWRKAYVAWKSAGRPGQGGTDVAIYEIAHYNAKLKEKQQPSIAKQNQGKPRYSLIRGEFLDAIAACMSWGLAKYPEENYLALDAKDLYDSMMRHLRAHQRSEGNDTESGLPHLHHFASNAMMFFMIETKKGTGEK